MPSLFDFIHRALRDAPAEGPPIPGNAMGRMIADETPPPPVMLFNTIPHNASGPMIQDETPWVAGPNGPSAATALDRLAANGWNPPPTLAFRLLGFDPNMPYDPAGIYPRAEAYRPERDMAARANVPSHFSGNFNARVQQGMLDTQAGLALAAEQAAGATGFSGAATGMGTAADDYARQAGRFHPQGGGAWSAEAVGTLAGAAVPVWMSGIGKVGIGLVQAAQESGENYRMAREAGMPHDAARLRALAAGARAAATGLVGGVAAKSLVPGQAMPFRRELFGTWLGDAIKQGTEKLPGRQEEFP